MSVLALLVLALAGCAEKTSEEDYWQEREEIWRDELVAMEPYRDTWDTYDLDDDWNSTPSLKLAEASRAAARSHEGLVESMDALEPPKDARENHELLTQGWEAKVAGFDLEADCIEQVRPRLCIQSEQQFELAQHYFDEADEALPDEA